MQIVVAITGYSCENDIFSNYHRKNIVGNGNPYLTFALNVELCELPIVEFEHMFR